MTTVDEWHNTTREGMYDDEPRTWTRNDQADHEDGHPSGYDCDGYAILPPHEVCARRYETTPPAPEGVTAHDDERGA